MSITGGGPRSLVAARRDSKKKKLFLLCFVGEWIKAIGWFFIGQTRTCR